MFGVVLWCSSADQKAVVWCEDHGDLAFFDQSVDTRDSATSSNVNFDAGDLICFDLSEDGQMRQVMNPRLVAEDRYPGLASNLQNAGQMASSSPQKAEQKRERPRFSNRATPVDKSGGKVIAFSRKKLRPQEDLRIPA